MISVEDARARGLTLPADEDAAQAIVDEQEAWLARRIGGLDDEIVETFYVGVSRTTGKLGLRRYTDEVVVTDGGAVVDPSLLILLDLGASVGRVYPALWWTGPYVTVTYTPNDALEVQRALYDLIAMEGTPDGQLVSETLGKYSYDRGVGAANPKAAKAAIVAGILPRRDQGVTVSVSRRTTSYDPVINRPEPEVYPYAEPET